MSKRIKLQKIRVIQVQKDSSHTEQSSYWDDVNNNKGDHSNGGTQREHSLANPDTLPHIETVAPSTPQLLMGEAVEHLQGRQKEIYLLVMREGRSLAEAAEVLGIEKGTAQKYKERAIKFIASYCQEAMSKGRV